MEGFKKWLVENPLAAFALRRLAPAILGAAIGALGVVGLVDPQVVAACQRALGL